MELSQAWRNTRIWAKRHLAELASSFVALTIFIGGYFAYLHLPPEATWDERAQLAQCILLGLGLDSIILLLVEGRQKASWNRVRFYHEHFGELPVRAKVLALYDCLRRLKIEPPSNGQPLSPSEAIAILSDVGVAADNGMMTCRPGGEVVREYLNDFEEFCGAINVGILSEHYARELDGARTINAYYGFEEVIKKIREREVRRRRPESSGEGPQSDLRPLHRKPYHELRRVAATWKRRREREYQRLLKKQARNQRRQEQDDENDGVPPEAV